jgi:diguanylate cyclase (GGDEF)-like protein/PAS domain S-box-containing protein
MQVGSFDLSFFKEALDNLYDAVYVLDRQRHITYWNKAAEELTGYTWNEVQGRSCSDGLLMHCNKEGTILCLDACPASATMYDGQRRQAEIFLHHKEGHRVPVRVRVSPLHDEEGRVIGAIEVFSENYAATSLRQQVDELREQMLLCPLTEIGNRRFLELKLESRLAEFRRYGWPFGIVFADIDYFKQINDTHGHPVGDQALVLVARTLRNSLRGCDQLGRWGGEEFMAIVSNSNDDILQELSERCRGLIETSTLQLNGTSINLTISIGATSVRPGESLEDVLGRADRLLYDSKNRGRNTVTHAP